MSLLLELWAISGLAAVSGWRAGKFSRKASSSVALGVCGILIGGIYLTLHPASLPNAMMYPTLLQLFECWFAPPIAFLVAMACRQAQRGGMRTSPLALKIAGVSVLVLASAALIQRQNSYKGVAEDMGSRTSVDRNGVVRQSTRYTCAAAACATLLRKLDVEPGASERELAPMCGTLRNDGAPSLGMAVALNSIAAPKGWNVRLMLPDWDELCRMKMPVVVSVHEDEKLDHALVVCGVDAHRGVLLADPSRGLYWQPAAVFKRKFNHEAVSVFQGTPYLETDAVAVR